MSPLPPSPEHEHLKKGRFCKDGWLHARCSRVSGREPELSSRALVGTRIQRSAPVRGYYQLLHAVTSNSARHLVTMVTTSYLHKSRTAGNVI